jgi:hypothetical protein
MADILAQLIIGGIVGIALATILALFSGYEFRKGFATAALIILGAELFTGQFFMLIGTIISALAAIALVSAFNGKIG